MNDHVLEQGFAQFSEVFNPLEIRDLSRQIASQSRTGTRCLLDCKWCQQIAGKLQGRLNAKLPMLWDLNAVQCTYFNKSLDNNWLVAFHQDLSIPVAEETPSTYRGWSKKEGMTFIQAPDTVLSKMLALRVHLDPSSTDNGSLRVLPKSHLAGTLVPQQIQQYRMDLSSISIILEKGDVLAMRPLLLHASSKSTTDTPRRVLHFLFGPRSLPDNLRWRIVV